ncbi:MAG: hypothetical protein HDR44_05195 [Allobaculum sp.]|nr:hypothetical protein [Allobaculum sp.]
MPKLDKEKKRQKDLERLSRLRPIDDDFMRCIFKDDIPLAQFVLRIIIDQSDLIIIKCETQKDMKRLGGSRSISLDLYGIDSKEKRYDLEIQRAKSGADPHRARYHSSILDIENLDASQNFNELPETYVIFFCEKDPFGQGLPLYHIDRTIRENGQEFQDGEHIIYVNGEFRDDSPIGKLMHDFNCADPDEMYFSLMAERTRYLKESEEGINQMCEIFEEIREEGRIEGSYDRACSIALELLSKNLMTLEDISQVTQLPMEEVKKLQVQP